eukprot:scaffold8463_cov142-Alexandrium_tamarense.AAC.2
MEESSNPSTGGSWQQTSRQRFSEKRPEDIGDATWSEVATACCVHDAHGWGVIFVGVCAALFFLYFFLLSLELLGSSAKVLGGCSAGGLMGDNVNPWQDW